jgi:hypothetical protein
VACEPHGDAHRRQIPCRHTRKPLAVPVHLPDALRRVGTPTCLSINGHGEPRPAATPSGTCRMPNVGSGCEPLAEQLAILRPAESKGSAWRGCFANGHQLDQSGFALWRVARFAPRPVLLLPGPSVDPIRDRRYGPVRMPALFAIAPQAEPLSGRTVPGLVRTVRAPKLAYEPEEFCSPSRLCT